MDLQWRDGDSEARFGAYVEETGAPNPRVQLHAAYPPPSVVAISPIPTKGLFGRVTRSILYDNTKLAVARISPAGRLGRRPARFDFGILPDGLKRSFPIAAPVP